MEELKKLVSKLNDVQKSSISGSIILIILICGDIAISIGEVHDSYEITGSMFVTAFILCGIFWILGFFSSYRDN